MALDVALAIWGMLELSLRVGERLPGRGGSRQDRGTRTLIGVLFGAAIALAVMSKRLAPSLQFSGDGRIVLVGAIVMSLGLVIRVWAIVVLGGAFRTTVEVDLKQKVVSRGPYRWIRHPSYAGLLLILTDSGSAPATGWRSRQAQCRRRWHCCVASG